MGSRAAGVFARAIAQRLELDSDGRAPLRLEIVAQATAYTGRARVALSVADRRGRSARAEIRFEVAARRLEVPARVDFGRAFAGARARAGLDIVLRDPTAASAWLDWGSLAGDWGEILPAFLRPSTRGVDLAPEEPARVTLELDVPRGARPGRYEGVVKVAAGPHKAESALVVEVDAPRLLAPQELELGRVAPGEEVSVEFPLRLEGALPERLELGFATPLQKTTRAEALLEGLEATAAGGAAEIAPGAELTVRLEGAIPPGQEDGTYEGELLVRAGGARAKVRVRLEVPRPPALAPFELQPRELSVFAPPLGEGLGSVRAKSNEDRPLELRARIESAESGSWELAFEDAEPSRELVRVLPPRGETEFVVVARAPDIAPGLGGRAALVVEAEGLSLRSEIALGVSRAAGATQVSPSTARLALVAAALACALLAASAWRSRAVRYASISAAIHALALATGVRSPFVSLGASLGAAQTATLVRVIQVPDPYGVEPLAQAEPVADRSAGRSGTNDPAELASAGVELPLVGAPLRTGPAGAEEVTSPGDAELPSVEARSHPVPAHPDAPLGPEARETLEFARAARPGPGGAPSEGFDPSGPEGSLSLLEPGRLARARSSDEEAFGALAELSAPGAVSRGPAALVEKPPLVAAPVREELSPETAAPARTARTVTGPARERPVLGALPETAPSLATRVARAAAPEGHPQAGLPVPGRTVPRETPAPRATPPTETAHEREASPEPGRPRADRARAPERTLALPFEPPEGRPPVPAGTLARAGAAPPSEPVPALEARRPHAEEVVPSPVVQKKPAAETEEPGLQTIARTRGQSPAGVLGRPDEPQAPLELGPKEGLTGASAQTLAPGAIARASTGLGTAPAPDASCGSSPTGRARALRARIDIGVLKHAGDWAVAPRAMTALAREFASRLRGQSLELRATPLRATEDALFDCAFVYVTGRRDMGLDQNARSRLKTYLERGGFLWVDDGSPPGDDSFDRAWRELAGALLPGASIRRLPSSHPLFAAWYDLSRGYLGRSPPSGAWSRQGEVEGLFAQDGRLVAVYTRNGYGRAIEIDPNSDLTFVPPPGLTPREAKEGATRLAVNIAVHALRSGGEGLPGRGSAAEPEDPAIRYRYRGPAAALRAVGTGLWDPAGWRPVEGGSPVRVSARDGSLQIEIAPSDRDWAAAEGPCPEGLAASRALVLNAKTRLATAARLALRFRSAGGELYETVPLYVRATANEEALRVPLDASDFRSTATGWRLYDAPFDRTKKYVSVAVVVYAKGVDGAIELSNLRLEGW